MTRQTALQIFGLDETASEAMLRTVHAALRAHLETRARAAVEMERPAAAAFFRDQLGELDIALALATDAASGSSRRAQRVTRTLLATESPRRWGYAIALLALVLIVGIGMQSLRSSVAVKEARNPNGSSSGAGESSAKAGAALLLRGNMQGTQAEIRAAEADETLWRGMLGGETHELPAGRYTLIATRPPCPDEWREEVELASGQRAERWAVNCREHGLLAVRANVDRGRLAIDGRAAGSPGESEISLEAGKHRIEVEGEGHETWRAEVDIVAGSRISLQATLAARETPSPRTKAEAQKPSPRPTAAKAEPYGLTHEWHLTAKQYLLARYDGDRSGHLDSLQEVRSIPCSDWRGLEQSFDRGGLALSMTRFYGFDGSQWVEDAFGLANEVRGEAFLQLRECGLR